MPRPFPIPRLAMAVAVAGAVVASGLPARAARDRARPRAGSPLLSDPTRLLSSHDRAALERRLADAEQRLGSPIRIVLVKQLHHESAREYAARTFDGWRVPSAPGAQAPDPILLLLSVRDTAAAVETGKGNAGIVPEVDARRIAGDLTTTASRKGLAQRLGQAVAELVESAEGTTARRRPLPHPEPTPDEIPADARAAADAGAPTEAAAGANPVDAGGTGAAANTDEAKTPPPRSKLPWAIAISVLLLVGLAMRRRRQVSQTGKTREGAPPMRKKPGAPDDRFR